MSDWRGWQQGGRQWWRNSVFIKGFQSASSFIPRARKVRQRGTWFDESWWKLQIVGLEKLWTCERRSQVDILSNNINWSLKLSLLTAPADNYLLKTSSFASFISCEKFDKEKRGLSFELTKVTDCWLSDRNFANEELFYRII